MSTRYIILDNCNTQDGILPPGVRIIKVNDFEFNIKDSEAFSTIDELISKSRIYMNLLVSNKERAIQIIKDEYIFKADQCVFIPRIKSFNNRAFDILVHSFQGKLYKGKLTGIHILHPTKAKTIRIKEVIQGPNSFGIYTAIVEKLNCKNGQWIQKRNPSTFFPDSWSLTRLMFECCFAFTRLRKVSECKFDGITLSGIPINLIIDISGRLKTIYPIFEETY